MTLLIALFACSGTSNEAPPPPQPAPASAKPAEAPSKKTTEAQPDDDEGIRAPNHGRWEERRSTQEEIEALEAIGYVGSSEGPAKTRTGVTVHLPQSAPGDNLWLSGHRAEARLMSADGKDIHVWAKTIDKVFPKLKIRKGDLDAEFWRKAHLYPNGDLLVIYEGKGIAKLDRDSNVIWAQQNLAHHDMHVLEDGRIWVLTRKAHVIEKIRKEKPVLEDFATLLTPDGEVIKQVSVLDALLESDAAYTFERRRTQYGDLMHTNAIHWLDGSAEEHGKAFAKGNLLLSSAELSAIYILDPESGKIVWHHTGKNQRAKKWMETYQRQHDPMITEDGDHLVLFDNKGPGNWRSAVLEYELPEMKETWRYMAEPREFFTNVCGSQQRLGDNTLIVETTQGRAFEVTRDGKIVWEYHNPHRAGPNGEFVAWIADMYRYPEGYFKP